MVSAMAASWLLNMFAEHMLNYCKSCNLHFSEIKSINRREAASKSVYLWHITETSTACNRRVWGHNKKSFMKAHKSFEPEVLFADDMHFSRFSFSARTSPAIIHQHAEAFRLSKRQIDDDSWKFVGILEIEIFHVNWFFIIASDDLRLTSIPRQKTRFSWTHLKMDENARVVKSRSTKLFYSAEIRNLGIFKSWKLGVGGRCC